jgi:hypothetical protein
MEKKRYTKPVVIDLGKQTLETIKSGMLSWDRSGSSAESFETCAEGAAVTSGCNTEDHSDACCDNKDESDKD